MRFAGRRALVTGGSSGIGKATALLLVAEGAHVAIAARGEERLEASVRELEARRASAGQRVVGVALDVRDAGSVERGVLDATRELGGLDLLLNNAGTTRPGHFLELPDQEFHEQMETNYFGSVRVTRACLPHLLAHPGSHVSFVSSVAGFLGVFGYSAYAPTKFALAGLAECLRQELEGKGVSVSVLFPPDTDTPQLAAETPLKPKETRAISGNVRVASPEEVARCWLRGIAAGTYHILPGARTRLVYFMQRHFPGVIRWAVDRDIRRARAGSRLPA